MNQRVRLAALAIGFCLFFQARAGATAITTTCWSQAVSGNNCPSGYWDSPTFISGQPTELDFTVIKTQAYPSGIALDAKGNSSLAFPFTGGSMQGNSSSGSLFGTYIDVATPSAGDNALILHLSSSGTMTVTLSDGSFLSGGSGFFGFSLSHPITTLAVTTTAGQVTINDFYFAASSLQQESGGGTDPTPEAATILLATGGFFILFGTGRVLGQKRLA